MPKSQPLLSRTDVLSISEKDMTLHVEHWKPRLKGDKETLRQLSKQMRAVHNRCYAKRKRDKEKGMFDKLQKLVELQQLAIEDLETRQLLVENKRTKEKQILCALLNMTSTQQIVLDDLVERQLSIEKRLREIEKQSMIPMPSLLDNFVLPPLRADSDTPYEQDTE